MDRRDHTVSVTELWCSFLTLRQSLMMHSHTQLNCVYPASQTNLSVASMIPTSGPTTTRNDLAVAQMASMIWGAASFGHDQWMETTSLRSIKNGWVPTLVSFFSFWNVLTYSHSFHLLHPCSSPDQPLSHQNAFTRDYCSLRETLLIHAGFVAQDLFPWSLLSSLH